MSEPAETRTVSITIRRDWREVYDFACVPENAPRWASGLATTIRREGDHWIGEGPDGRVAVRFSPRNDYGVLDHHVTPGSGVDMYIPMRVIANGSGAEVSLTLFRAPGASDALFARDQEWVARDLEALRTLLET
jgi:hypothetical protein